MRSALWLFCAVCALPSVASAQYRVRRGDTLTSIAAAQRTTVHELRRLNPSVRRDRIYEGQALRVSRGTIHRVRRGETVRRIARRYGVRVDAIAAANRRRLPNPNRVAIGARLLIPRGAGSALDDPRTACADRLIFEDRVSPAFARRVRQVARRLRMDPDHLMAVMHYETAGTFRANIRNPHSRAVGLIQFLPVTARRLGTNHRRLARLGPVAQLRWVQRYLMPYRGRMRTIEDAYLAVFTPAAIGRRPGYVLYRRGQRSYHRNLGHDRNRDGRITKAEVGTNARLRWQQGVRARAARCR